jgi:uncharacterized protein (DUF58 family)
MARSLVTKVKAKIHIPSYRKALAILEGEYNSAAFGRSLEFEDLREYQPGDDVKDIDWKATARHTEPLVRRYIAGRRHPVIFVMDTGINMRAVTPSGERKIDVGVLAAGILGFLAVRHTDSVSAYYGDEGSAAQTQARSSESHLERILQTAVTATTNSKHQSSITRVLSDVQRNVRSRSILIVIADGFEVTDENVNLLRRLRHKHEMFWISVADIDPSAAFALDDQPYDIGDGFRIPDFVMSNTDLLAEYEASETQRVAEMADNLAMLAIPAVTLESSEETLLKLITLLKRRRKKNEL